VPRATPSWGSEVPGGRPAVCVFCASSERVDPAAVLLAEQVGAEVARRGWTLVSGGGSVSSMGAVARAARAAGGTTVGVIPRALVAMEVADHGADELVVTDDMRQRKGVMDRRSDAFLALPGGLGTLEELLEVWVAASLGMHGKPVVVLDPEGVYAGLRSLVEALVAQGYVREEAAAVVSWTPSVAAALDAVEEGWREVARRAPRPDEILEADL
jgi:uncharacterized protein (TIGR00730 family)